MYSKLKVGNEKEGVSGKIYLRTPQKGFIGKTGLKQKVWLIQRQFDIHRFKDYKIKSLMDNLQSDDRSNKRECKKQSPKRRRFFKYQYPDKDCSHSSNSSPYRICSTKRNGFGGFG